jgi:integrase
MARSVAMKVPPGRTFVWARKWTGGRVRVGRKGKQVWVLERMVDGHPYTKTLDVGNEQDALTELALFGRDPRAYLTKSEEAARPPPAEGPVLDAPTVRRFLDYLRKEGRTERYRRNVEHYLAAWGGFYAGRDIRAVPLQEILKELGRHPHARKNRITSLKSFTAFLREQDATLTSKEDPTLELKVPPPRPQKSLREKGYSIEQIEKLYAAINGWESAKYGWKDTGRKVDVQPVRDVLVLHAKCGMHATEIARLARGEGEVKPVDDQGEIAGTFKFVHKSGRVHIQSVDAQALAAAQRLQARRSAPVDSHIRRVINHAVDAWNRQIRWTPSGLAPREGRQPLKPINFGELRQSFVTWAHESGQEVRPKQGGVPLHTVASVIGHQSALTTKRLYEGVKVPVMIKIPIRLSHPEEPARPDGG